MLVAIKLIILFNFFLGFEMSAGFGHCCFVKNDNEAAVFYHSGLFGE